MTPRARQDHPYANRFLSMLPQLRAQARFAFRQAPPGRRQELIAETIANCWLAFVRLIDRRLDNLIYPTPLVRYAVRQVRDGRRVGCRLNINDVSSEYAQRRRGFRLWSLDGGDRRSVHWRQILVEDQRAGPADTAAVRIDFAAWLQGLPRQKRRIALMLAAGETTQTAARQFRVSPGRISQLRRELQAAWQTFQSEPGPASGPPASRLAALA